MNKPALALAVVGASLAVFQAVSPARPLPSGAAIAVAPRLGAATALMAGSATPPPTRNFATLADAAQVRPLANRLPRRHDDALTPDPARLAAALADGDDAITVSHLHTLGSDDAEAAALAAAALRGLGGGDPWSRAAGTMPAATFDPAATPADTQVIVTSAIARQLAATPAGPATAPAGGGTAPGNAIGLPEFAGGPLASAVPETSTWATLLAGLALIGINLRRRGPRDVLS